MKAMDNSPGADLIQGGLAGAPSSRRSFRGYAEVDERITVFGYIQAFEQHE
jgi:hypothetical protein